MPDHRERFHNFGSPSLRKQPPLEDLPWPRSVSSAPSVSVSRWPRFLVWGSDLSGAILTIAMGAGVDLADRVVSDAVEDIGQIGLRIDAVHLGGLCRTPDYAELAPPSRRLPLVCVYIIRHSLTVDRLPTRTWGVAPFSTGTSENACVATGCARCRGHRFCGWCS